MGKSTSDRSIIVYYDVEYIHNRQSDLAYSVTTETIGNIYGNHLGGAPAFIWTILLRRYYRVGKFLNVIYIISIVKYRLLLLLLNI